MFLNDANGKVGTEQLTLPTVRTLVPVGRVRHVVPAAVYLMGGFKNKLRAKPDADATSLAARSIDHDHRLGLRGTKGNQGLQPPSCGWIARASVRHPGPSVAAQGALNGDVLQLVCGGLDPDLQAEPFCLFP